MRHGGTGVTRMMPLTGLPRPQEKSLGQSITPMTMSVTGLPKRREV
jgi:hypothetical protein